MTDNSRSRQAKINTQAIIKALYNFSKGRVLVIGDIMVDEYLWGVVRRISPEAPVQIVEVERWEYRLGGCGNVVNNLCSLGASVSVASVTGEDSHRQFILDTLGRLGVDIQGLILDNGRPTTKKTRVIATNQQVVRIDFESRHSISNKHEKNIAEFLHMNADRFDVILLSDYGKGVLTDRLSSCAIKTGKRWSIPIIVDPEGKNFSKYSGATIITPNTKEAEIVSNIEIKGDSTAEKAARKILMVTKCDSVIITRGSQGMTLLDSIKGKAIQILAQAREVFDVSGAGDTVLAVLGLGMASGLSFKDASYLANVAGGVVVGKLGTSVVTRDELFSAFYGEEEKRGYYKESTLNQLENLVHNLKAQNKRIVFTHATFDQLHAWHIKLLQKAGRLGDILIVGINSDKYIRRLKGVNWPFISQKERVKILSALKYVDYVVIFEQDSLLRLIQRLQPDIIVMPNHIFGVHPGEMIGPEIVEEYGGRIDLVDLQCLQSVQ